MFGNSLSLQWSLSGTGEGLKITSLNLYMSSSMKVNLISSFLLLKTFSNAAVFHLGLLSLRSSHINVIFHCCSLSLRLSLIEVIFHWGKGNGESVPTKMTVFLCIKCIVVKLHCVFFSLLTLGYNLLPSNPLLPSQFWPLGSIDLKIEIHTEALFTTHILST